MTATALRCAKCANLLVADDLFCPTCGHEAPAAGEAPPAQTREVHRFDCDGCGACLTWDVATQGLRCSFCGEERLRRQPKPVRAPVPDRVVPFAISHDDATAAFRAWVGEGLFRPGDVRRASEITELRGVYLPFWSFSGSCDTVWAADSDEGYGRAPWRPVFGTRQGTYGGVLVPASGALTLAELRALGTFDLAQGVPYHGAALGGHPAEAFGVTRRRARSLGIEALEALERDASGREVPGTHHRYLHSQTLVRDLTALPALLPVWIVAYAYRGKTYRYVVNGQTGQAEGTAPVSVWRVLGCLLVLALGVAALVGAIALIAGNV